MTTATAPVETSETPFFHTLPLWVLDAAEQQDIRKGAIVAAHTTAKQSILTLDNGESVKVYRRHAFPGRIAA